MCYVSNGSNNTSIGYRSGINILGSNNTAVGSISGLYPVGIYSNTGQYGYNTFATGSNRVHIGNTSIVWIGGQVNWSTYSDARYKNNIQENVPGLDFILQFELLT